MNSRRANASAVTLVFGEAALFLNVLLWLFYAHRPVIAGAAVLAMLALWRLHKWADQ